MASEALPLLATLGFAVVLYYIDKYTAPLFDKERPGHKVLRAVLALAQLAIVWGAWFWFDTRVLGQKVTLGQWLTDYVVTLGPLILLCAISIMVAKAMAENGTAKEKENAQSYGTMLAFGIWLSLVSKGVLKTR